MTIMQAIRVIRSMQLRAVYSVSAQEFRFAPAGVKWYETAQTPEEAVNMARLVAQR